MDPEAFVVDTQEGLRETSAKTREPIGLGNTQFAFLMLLPAAVIVAGTLLYPLAFSFWTSVNEVSPVDLSMRFVGLKNYVETTQLAFFSTALTNTLYFAVVTIVGTVVLGLAIALVLNEPFLGRGVLRTLVIVPWALSQVVVGIIWGWIYNGTFGVLNAVLKGVGLIPAYEGWLSDPSRAMNLVALTFIWSTVPFAVVMYLASLQTIPEDLYKAARVDGASVIQRFFHITLPALRYTTLVILIVASLDGLLAFTLIWVMTGGGPGTSTTVLSWLGYQTTFVSLNLGTGAAVFYLLVFMLLAVTAAYVRVLHRPAEEGA
jgi:ABC-type sugar transport system permease subunit